jgi:soluble lytic murein transglycosylase-like protein
MRLRLALACLSGGLVFFMSCDPIRIPPLRPAAAMAKPSPIRGPKPSLIDSALDKLASLPASAERFLGELGALPKPSYRDNDESIDAPKDSITPSSLERARAALAESNAPELSRNEICTSLVAVAQKNELPLGFLTNLIWRESRFDHAAISPVGAMGIAQFMPDVADKMEFDAFNAREALPASGRLLRALRDRFGNNLGLIAAAYNAGPKRVADWLQQRSGLPRETREYVSLITGKPVEQWRGAGSRPTVFNVPREVPCHRTAEFSEVERAERAEQLQKIAEEQRLRRIAEEQRLRKIAEERRLAEKARHALGHAKKNKGRVMTASRGQSS